MEKKKGFLGFFGRGREDEEVGERCIVCGQAKTQPHSVCLSCRCRTLNCPSPRVNGVLFCEACLCPMCRNEPHVPNKVVCERCGQLPCRGCESLGVELDANSLCKDCSITIILPQTVTASHNSQRVDIVDKQLVLSEPLKDGAVVLLGSNAYRQLGAAGGGDACAWILPGVSDVVLISAGQYHSAFVTEKNELWTCGRNVEMQLGHSQEGVSRVVLPEDFGRIAQVECGNYHTSVLSETGQVLETGRGIGLHVVRHISGVVSIACGGTFTVAHCADKKATFGWDEGFPVSIHGLKGLALLDVKACKWEALFLTDDMRILMMRFVPGVGMHELAITEMRPLDVSIASLACGTSTNCVSTTDGLLVQWKRNGSTGEISDPVQIDLPGGYASSVHCGGRLWACTDSTGLYVDGELRIRSSSPFSSVSCGFLHVIALVGPPKGNDFQQDMIGLRQEEGDMTLSCADGTVSLHRVFLLGAGLDPDSISLLAFSSHSLDVWLSYLYTGRVILSEPLCKSLKPIVDVYGPPRLRALVYRHLQLSQDQTPHENALYSRLKPFLSQGDILLMCEDGAIRFWRCILKARSPYFSALFSDRWTVSESIQLDYCAAAVDIFIRWCAGVLSGSDLPFSDENVADVLQLANAFGNLALVRCAERYLYARILESHQDMDLEMLQSILSLAELLKRSVLERHVRNIINNRR